MLRLKIKKIFVTCHELFSSIAGNCQVCLVELKNSMKPVVSCTTNAKAALYNNTMYQPFRSKIKKNQISFCRFGINSVYKQNRINILKYNKLFSSTTEGSSDSSNETKLEEMSFKKLRTTLKNMTVVSLKKLAKDYKINLRGQRKKAQIISFMIDYFSKLKTVSSEDNLEVLANGNTEQKGLMISNSFISQREDNFMNISAIFRLDERKKYSKWRNTQTTKDFLADLTDTLKLSSEKKLFSIIKRGQGDIFAHPFVAIDVAAYVSSRFKVIMYNYVFHTLNQNYLTDEQVVKTKKYKTLFIELTQTRKRLGEILLKRSWHTFKQGFCYYVIKVMRTTEMYKMGVSKNINETFRRYRRLDATFQIIFLMYFSTEKDMNDFDIFQNRVLEPFKLLLSKEQVINLTSEEILDKIHKTIKFANFSDKVTIESFESLNKYNQIVPSTE
jgi:hypothetical protein